CWGCNNARGIMPASKFHWLELNEKNQGKQRAELAAQAAAAPDGILEECRPPYDTHARLTPEQLKMARREAPMNAVRRAYFLAMYGFVPGEVAEPAPPK